MLVLKKNSVWFGFEKRDARDESRRFLVGLSNDADMAVRFNIQAVMEFWYSWFVTARFTRFLSQLTWLTLNLKFLSKIDVKLLNFVNILMTFTKVVQLSI